MKAKDLTSESSRSNTFPSINPYYYSAGDSRTLRASSFNDTFHTVHTFISYKLMSHSFMLLCCVLATDHDGAYLSVIDKISVRRELA